MTKAEMLEELRLCGCELRDCYLRPGSDPALGGCRCFSGLGPWDARKLQRIGLVLRRLVEALPEGDDGR